MAADKVTPVDITPLKLAPLTGIKADYALPADNYSFLPKADDAKSSPPTELDDRIEDSSNRESKMAESEMFVEINVSEHNQEVPAESRLPSSRTSSSNSSSDGEQNEVPTGKRLKMKPATKKQRRRSEAEVWIEGLISEVLSDLTCHNLLLALRECKKSLMVLFVDKQTWSTGTFFFVVGLLQSFLMELLGGPRYNTTLLLCVMAAVFFHDFPGNSVRPQLVITLLTTTSFALDIYFLTLPLEFISNGVKALTVTVMLTKCLAVYDFLWLSAGASKARKYLQRRIRVFFIPLVRPRKVMREIRSRILALEWIQLMCGVGYLILFIASVSTAGFSSLMLTPSRGVPLFAFFPLKCITSLLVFAAFLADTDVILCLHHFGCLGWAMRSVKIYIHKRKEEYGGWPLPYGLNPYRFYVICGLKFVDFCWGIGGWVTLGTTFGANFYNANDNIIALVSGSIFLLLLSDVWCPVLFYVVVKLLSWHEKDLAEGDPEAGTNVDSDDSELDDFNIRNDQKAAQAAHQESRRRLMFRRRQHMQRVGSRSDDENTSSSDEEITNRRRRRRRRQRKRQDDFDTAEQDDDWDEERGHGTHQVHIDLDMALGTLVDDNEEEEDEEEEERERETTPTDDKHPVQRSSVPSVRANHFSPGKGDWGNASVNAERYTAQNQTRALTYREKRPLRHVGDVMIDPSPVITPDSYTAMWESMPEAVAFDARLYAEEEVATFKLVQLVEHLQSEGFYVVAAGQVEDIATLYGFGSGTDSVQSPIYFLFELKILMNGEVPGREGFWSFECVCKCTHNDITSTFVKMLLLGDVLRLAG